MPRDERDRKLYPCTVSINQYQYEVAQTRIDSVVSFNII